MGPQLSQKTWSLLPGISACYNELGFPPPNCLQSLQSQILFRYRKLCPLGQINLAIEIGLKYVFSLYLKGYFLVILTHVLSPKEIATCQQDSQEIFLQVLNLADDEVKVKVLGDENNTLLAESIKSFQVTNGHECIRNTLGLCAKAASSIYSGLQHAPVKQKCPSPIPGPATP